MAIPLGALVSAHAWSFGRRNLATGCSIIEMSPTPHRACRKQRENQDSRGHAGEFFVFSHEGKPPPVDILIQLDTIVIPKACTVSVSRCEVAFRLSRLEGGSAR